MAVDGMQLYSLLTGLGDRVQKFGESQRQQQLLSDLGTDIGSGNYAGAARRAIAGGDLKSGLSLLDLGKKMEADKAAFAEIGGMSGGVTPNPQPMSAPGGSPGSGQFNIQKAYDLIKQAGGSDQEARMLAAIAQPESSGNPMAHNPNGADDSYGLWQINMRGDLGPERMKQFGLSSLTDLYNPETNAKAALELARARGGYDDWSTFKNGSYKQYLPAQNVQVADASGAIPASAVPPQGGDTSALLTRRDNIMRALSRSDLSDNAIKRLNLLLDDVKFRIDRADKEANRTPVTLGEGQILVDPRTGRQIAAGGPGSKLEGEVDARRRIVMSQGGDPNEPRNQQFINTGRYPREDAQPLSATDKKAILEADEGGSAAQSAIDALTQAKKLSPRALGGYGAGARAAVGANLPDFLVPDKFASPQSSESTQELDNLVGTNALSQLKAIFGSNPTEGERAIMLELQGSSSKTDPVRQKIYDRAIEMAKRRLDFNRQRAEELRGGSYFKPDGAPRQQMSPPAAAIDALRANPRRRDEFDAKYGQGASDLVLGGAR